MSETAASSSKHFKQLRAAIRKDSAVMAQQRDKQKRRMKFAVFSASALAAAVFAWPFLGAVGNALNAVEPAHAALTPDADGSLMEIAEAEAAAPEGLNPDDRAQYEELIQLGNKARGANDLAWAREYYQTSLDLASGLADKHPQEVALKRDITVSRNKLGRVSMEIGHYGEAQQHFVASLQERRALLKANPTSFDALRDVSVSLENLGDVLTQTGDVDGARKYFDESLKIRSYLARSTPNNVQAQRDQWAVMWRLAGIPDSAVTWVDVVRKLEVMHLDGKLAPADEGFLVYARKVVSRAS